MVGLPFWDIFLGFPGGSDGSKSACNAGDTVGEILWRRNGFHSVFLPEEVDEQRSVLSQVISDREVTRGGHDWATNRNNNYNIL